VSARTPARRARSPRFALTVQYAAPRKGLPRRASIERWIRAALERPAAVTVRFVGAAEGRALNRDFRGRDYATNVLTFAYHEPDAPLAGDLVLCAPVVKREATEQGKALRAHFAHLLVHGVLHLQGYDHERRAEAHAMEMRERRILAGLGYPDPYAA